MILWKNTWSHFMIPTKAPIFWGDTTPPHDFPYNPRYYPPPRSIPSFLCHPSCFVTIHCSQILSKFVFWTQPHLATYFHIHFPHPNPEKNHLYTTSYNQPQKTYHHMIHTSHQHWNPEIHHATSTGNPGISPPLLQPSWNYYWNCWRTQRWDPFWDLPWSHLLGQPTGGIGQLGVPWKVGVVWRGKLIWDSYIGCQCAGYQLSTPKKSQQ